MFDKQTSELKLQLDVFQKASKSIVVTSSFQSDSIPLLHLISEYDRTIPVCFLDTGFHFPETYQFVDTIRKQLNLNLVVVKSDVSLHLQLNEEGMLLFATDTDRCCQINKVLPMDKLLVDYDVWISGVRSDQNTNRATMEKIEPGPQNTTRYHPMLEWTSRDIHLYRKTFNLPTHPLEKEGYLSVGCQPCTRKYLDGLGDRIGRWQGQDKNECGLHTTLRSTG